MSHIYDNWERLVAAALKKQELWQLFHSHSRSPSVLSEASDFSSFRSLGDVDFAVSGSSSQSFRETFAKLPPKLVLVSAFAPAFGIEDVFSASPELIGRGTFGIEDVFSASPELIGRGTFGSVYTALMGNGVKIVVKRLKSGVVSESVFKQNMEIVGNVKHENVVALRAYYSSGEERLMLYDHYTKGSTYSLLHGQPTRARPQVDWETRVKIAIGAAQGIAAIHSQNGGKLIHGNIRASNIFLNSQHYGLISDLGLANMIPSSFMTTEKCYAPEVKNTQNISQASDVYSFGVLLLELLTRKSAEHINGGPQAVDLVKLVTSVKSKEWAAKVFDADLLENSTIKEQMIKLLQIGISCVAKSPKKRPKMTGVVKMLENISMKSSETPASSSGKLLFIKDIPAFDLEDLLRASAEVLGKGTFGTSYKAAIENGNIVAVKRLKDVAVTFKDFQQHMEVIGRLTHDNVADVVAYYFSRDEKILVYDYYNQGSVSTLLHGDKGDGRAPLDWEARLKIAVGAARGIAHIHLQDGRTLVHGNIKSANIFCNGQQYGLISNAGLAKLMSPIRPSAMPNRCYCAPEVNDTRNVSQASDIYSFGVVLLELVTGKQSQHTTSDGEVISLVRWVHAVLREEWTSEVIDLELLRDGSNDEEQMVRLLQIGADCVATAPENRPKMPQVVQMLEEISGIYVEDQPTVESRLEYLLDDLLPALIY